MDVYLNGAMLPEAEAQVHVQDAGIQHGVGLFETIAVRNGRAFRPALHVQRLIHSARELGLGRPVDAEHLLDAIRTTIAHNAVREARLRLTVTGGQISLLSRNDEAGDDDGTPPVEPTVFAVATPPTVYDSRYFEQGIMVTVAPQAVNGFDPVSGHKTLAYWSRLLRLRQAAQAGAGEVIHLSNTNHLASGAISNLLLVKDGALLTPWARGEEEQGALPAAVLPGITRQTVIEIAERKKIPVHRRTMSIDDLLEADEVMLTNASWHILPVTRVEKKTIADGRVGPMTTMLREALLELIAHETTTDEVDEMNGLDR